MRKMSLVIEEDVDQTSTVYEAFYNKYFPGWSEEFEKYRKEMKNVSDIIGRVEERTNGYSPEKEQLFSFLNDTPLDKVKVVIWTDEPYTISRNWMNIHKELKNQFTNLSLSKYDTFKYVASQGVLFVTASLCYSNEDRKAYSDIWFRFTNIIVEILNTKVKNCIHLMWGKNCQKLIDSIKSREIYTAEDPRDFRFFGNNHFIKANITLKRQGKETIEWV